MTARKDDRYSAMKDHQIPFKAIQIPYKAKRGQTRPYKTTLSQMGTHMAIQGHLGHMRPHEATQGHAMQIHQFYIIMCHRR